jgi:hypothetical protein
MWFCLIAPYDDRRRVMTSSLKWFATRPAKPSEDHDIPLDLWNSVDEEVYFLPSLPFIRDGIH